MRHPRSHLHSISVRFVILSCVFSACTPSVGTEEARPFKNVDGRYVGDTSCFDCHEDQYRGFQEHGMARSMYPLTAENAVENFDAEAVYHPGSNFYYRAFERDGRFFQEEYRLGDAGEKVHSLVREMQLVVGSGSAARTYLTENEGRYYQLPLTWYTQKRTWELSPGYAAANARFERLIQDRCMVCHNSYPEPVAFVEGKYEEVPHGIGCERCHGPGSVHVEARLAAPEPPDEVDSTIVNPAHLPLDRRLDVCQQCHLNATVAVLRDGRTEYDFRPSERIDDHVALFAAEGVRAEDEIEVISHSDRMKRSECFLGTQASAEPMDCTTCHDPHEGFRDKGPEYFNATCRSCHESLRLETEAMQALHSASSNCFGCHMPEVQSEDVPHASFTDHWIRVVEASEQTDGSPPASSDAIRLTPYFEKDRSGGDVYRGIAYVMLGRNTGDAAALRRGVEILEANLSPDDTFGEAFFRLGWAGMRLGRIDEAVEALERASSLEPEVPERWTALVQAYEAAGREPAEIEGLLERALTLQPALASVRVYYGRHLEMQGRVAEAIDQYRAAIDEQPWLEQAHYNLGTAFMRVGRAEEAEPALREAINLQPDYSEALGSLAVLLAGSGRTSEAGPFFERAAAASPGDPLALGNLGTYYLNAGRPADAVPPLERAVAIEPTYLDGLISLSLAHYRLRQFAQARQLAERAIQIDPNNAAARQMLDALQGSQDAFPR